MADVPIVLFVTCSDTHPDEIIKLFLNVSDLPQKVLIKDEIYGHPWCIDNKYYTARVNLCSLLDKKINCEKLANCVEAVVIHFDSSSENALEKVESWLSCISECTPEIKILVAENVPNDDENRATCTKKKVLEWCVGKGFELVELNPIVEDDDNDSVEDDFPETTGVERIMQALNAHVWPNLIMKKSENQKRLFDKVDLNSVQSNLNNVREELGLEESLEELLEIDDFSHLFSQLSEMKARVSSLSGEDRKEAAEQVVKAFWKAMGGPDDEL